MKQSTFAAVLVPIRREGWPFIGLAAAVTALVAALDVELLWVAGAMVTAWCAYFFRDPPRVTPGREGLIVSPADGVIQAIAPASPPDELGMAPRACTRISVFMNIFDVHVNRMPVSGTVVRLTYRPGRFIDASLDKASEHNERRSMLIVTADGAEVCVVQIAGLIARRIVCWVEEGATLAAGERIGMIRFGSRVDLYLPEGVEPLVAVGQRSIAGETVFADVRSQEPPRTGVKR